MEKHFSLQIKEGTEVKLALNQAFSYKFAQFLGVTDATAENIAAAFVNSLQTDSLNTIKYLISAGIYGHEFVSNDAYTSKFKPSDIGKFLLDLETAESERLVNAVFNELGYNLKAEAQNIVEEEEGADVKKK